MLPHYYCRKFPWRYQRPSSGLVVGCGAILPDAIKWVQLQGPFLAACHYDPHDVEPYPIAPGVNNLVEFFCNSAFFSINHATTSRHDITSSVNASLCQWPVATALGLQLSARSPFESPQELSSHFSDPLHHIAPRVNNPVDLICSPFSGSIVSRHCDAISHLV